MNNDTKRSVIDLRAVSKSYSYYDTPKDRLRELFFRRSLSKERRILHNIDLKIGRGEVVGLIGENGAGKSTLLKIISGRLQPTSGAVTTQGTIAAILELGSGFIPDLSGRENVRLGGLLMGLSRRQIEKEMDKIIAFSELEHVIDLPFGTYSTGMQARLTFATAITVDPDILIVDEALSVGDNRFQLKSFSRMHQFKEMGKTILLVSHSMDSVTTFCDRAILMHKGRIIADGKPNKITGMYHNLLFGSLPESSGDTAKEDQSLEDAQQAALRVDCSHPDEAEGPTVLEEAGDTAPAMDLAAEDATDEASTATGYRYGDGRAVISRLCIFEPGSRQQVRQLESGKPYEIRMECLAKSDADMLYCGVLIRTPRGEIVFGTDTTLDQYTDRNMLTSVKAGSRVLIKMRFTAWLSAGTYFVGGAATVEKGKQSDMWFDAYEFVVVGTRNQHVESIVNLQSSFQIEEI